MYYQDKPNDIASPMEHVDRFRKDELTRVPTTAIRIVNYHNERVYGCKSRGILCNKPVRIPAEFERNCVRKGKGKGNGKNPLVSAPTVADPQVCREGSVVGADADADNQRVAANCNIFF